MPTTKQNLLPPNTHIGKITLNVRDLELTTDFYANKVGLEIIEKSSEKTLLGSNEIPLITLLKSNLDHPTPGSAGLYHSAILFKTKAGLAQALKSILEKAPESFEGSADHLVSEAFYFHDPEGNGLELYVDRPREEWQWENGKVAMATLYIDPKEFIQQNLPKKPIPLDARIGHIHLKVGDLAQAREFYVEILGFEITAELPTALFVAAGKYHHHIGMNVWESLGAGEREESLGLRSFTIVLPDEESFDDLAERLENNGIAYEYEYGQFLVYDPWKNAVLVKKDSKKNTP